MAKKIMWTWIISKTGQKQSGYLVIGGVESAASLDSMVLSDMSTWTSAWTTLGAAKRHVAMMMDRSRIKWDESAEPDASGDLLWVARIESGITSNDLLESSDHLKQAVLE
jgi:hypothetical protein